MRIMVKNWMYNDMQTKAGKYNWTLLWNKTESKKEMDKQKAFFVYGTVEKETEKAINFKLYSWNLNKAGRYITDAPIEKRFNIWIPKSAILKTDDITYTSMVYEC